MTRPCATTTAIALAIALAGCAGASESPAPSNNASNANNANNANNGEDASDDVSDEVDTSSGEDAAEDTPAEDTAPDAPEGLAVEDGAYLLDSLVLTEPSGPAAVLNALVEPNIESGAFLLLFRLDGYAAPAAPTTLRLRADAALCDEGGTCRFDPAAQGTPTDATIDAEGLIATDPPAERLSFPVAAWLGPDAMVLLPVHGLSITARLDGDALVDATLSGVVREDEAGDIEVPLGGDTIPLANLLGLKNADTDGDGEDDGWTVQGTFSAHAVPFQ